MSPTNPNDSSNSNNSSNSDSPNDNPAATNVTVSNTDLRCRLCGHNRSKCSICQTPRSHSSAADRHKVKKVPKTRRKAYCCKCKHKSKLVRFFDPDQKEKLALIKYTELKIDAAARLRSYIFQALKSEQCHASPTTCRGFPGVNTRYDYDRPGSGSPSLVVFNCQIPDHSSNVAASDLLQCRIVQVQSTTLRLSLLLASDHPIDTDILRSVLHTLLNQLATLTHRAFSALMPDLFPNRKAFQHSLGAAGRGVQAGYKELWAVACLTGMLSRETLIMESGERSIVASHDAGVQQLLRRTSELADELRLWLALLRGGRIL